MIAGADAMIAALTHLADVTERGDRYAIVDYAPDSSEYEGGAEPGSAWDEECDRRLAEIRAALPAGWIADWSDDDLVIEQIEEEEVRG